MQMNLNSQYFFYMETQTALPIPDEDNCMVVYSSSQCPEMAQNVIAKCLGLPCHNVRVITRRVGGGFGGKAVRSLPVSVNLFSFIALFMLTMLDIRMSLLFYFLHYYAV